MAVILRCWTLQTEVFLGVLLLLMLATGGIHTSEVIQLDRGKRAFEPHKNTANAVRTPMLPSEGKSAVFATDNSTTVVAQTGGTAKLPCVVRKFSNGVVSWVRKDNSPPTILTVGLGRYIGDDRFMVEHVRHLQNWGLVIMHVRPTDAGLYECQVSTHPATSIFIELRVTVPKLDPRRGYRRPGTVTRPPRGRHVGEQRSCDPTFNMTPEGMTVLRQRGLREPNKHEASAEIIGAPDLHVRAGSSLRLVCTIRESTEPLAYIFWYHDHKMINHESGVEVTMETASSVLQLTDADTTHSGNYTCHPSNAIPAYINVHVLNATEEENPAAMLHASSSGISTTLFMSVILIVTINITVTLNS